MHQLQQQTTDPLARHSLSPRELKAMLAAERDGEPFLAVREPGGALIVTVLRDDRAMLGRREGMDVQIAWDNEVSGLHAQLHLLGGEWTIEDDGLSRNGTFVNGDRLVGRHRLRDGDRVRVGRTLLAFGAGGAASNGTTVAAGDVSVPHLTEAQRRVLVALCRPLWGDATATTPASNQQIANEAFLSIATVKMHLRALFDLFGLSDLPQNEKRARLAERSLGLGLVSARDYP